MMQTGVIAALNHGHISSYGVQDAFSLAFIVIAITFIVWSSVYDSR